jgi:hypothetical protein
LRERETQNEDYAKYYNLEAYLLGDVAAHFKNGGCLNIFDFFCIVIWKANRAKSKIAKRLKDHHKESLESAVRALTSEMAQAASPRERLKVLIDGWGFRLPMSSVILSVLYPADFTVYDVRVCDQLKRFHNIQNKQFDDLWTEYLKYLRAVHASAPNIPDLRDKDRRLWGKSFFDQLEADVRSEFPVKTAKSGAS